MANLAQLIRDGGRKYAVVIRTLELGFLVALIGLLVAALAPAIAQYAAAIVGSFGILGAVAVGSYQGANAAKDWHSPATSPTTSTVTSSTTHPPAPPRQSGAVPTGDGP